MISGLILASLSGCVTTGARRVVASRDARHAPHTASMQRVLPAACTGRYSTWAWDPECGFENTP